MTSIGVINNVYARYFDISYYVVDWFVLIQQTAMVLSAFPLAVLTYNSITNSRHMLIFLSSCAILSCACSLISFTFPKLYAFIFFGQFVIGFGVLTSPAIIGSLATNWFPENQIAFALSFQIGGLALGCFMGYLIPSQLFCSEVILQNSRNESLELRANPMNTMEINSWEDETRKKFHILYGCVVSISTVLWTLIVIFVIEKPPIPPSLAQALKSEPQKGKINDVIKNMAKFFKECKMIISTKLFIQLTTIITLSYSCNEIENLLMSEMIREVFYSPNSLKTTNAVGGYALILFESGGFLAGFFSGKIIDVYGKHKITLCIFLTIGIISVSGLGVALHYLNIQILLLSNFFLGVSVVGNYISVTDMLLQHTYPKNPALVFLIFEGLSRCFVVLFGEVCRLLLSHTSSIAVIILMCVFLLLALTIAAFLQPTYNRAAASNLQSADEIEPLLNRDRNEDNHLHLNTVNPD